MRLCSVEGCGKRHRAKGLCNGHYVSQWRDKHPLADAVIKKKALKRYHADPLPFKRQRRASHLRKKYGLSLEQYDSLLQTQDGWCAICRTDVPGGNGSFHVDHAHVTGKVRGLLCHGRNLILGYGRDVPQLLRAAANYLESFNAFGYTRDMAASQITYSLVQSTLPGPPAEYQVAATVTATVTIPSQVFVYRFADGLYDHIASVLDIQQYPTTSTPGQPFFRQNTVTQTFLPANLAIDFSDTIKTRLTSLCNEYDIVATAFVPGTTSVTVP